MKPIIIENCSYCNKKINKYDNHHKVTCELIQNNKINILNDYNNGLDFFEISNKYNLSVFLIRKLFKDNKFYHKNCKYCNKLFIGCIGTNKKHEYTCKKLYENKANILLDYKLKMSSANISKKYKIGVNGIRKFLKENGHANLDSRNTIEHNFFKKRNSEMFWLLGMIASDGNIKNDKIWSISQSGEQGKRLIEYISNLTNHSNKIYTAKTKGELAHSICVSSTEMVKDLKNYQITERKTLILKFNYSIFDNNEENFKSFLRGYIDGDGCVYIGHQNNIKVFGISFVGNHNFINDLIPHLPYKDFSTCKLRNVTQIGYSGESAVKFCDWLYTNKDLYKHYKYQKYLDYINSNDVVRWSVYNKLYMENKHRLLNEKPWHICQDLGVSCDLVIGWKKRTDTIIKAGNYYYSK